MRIDHWVKNLLIFPGVFFAISSLDHKMKLSNLPVIALGIFTACLASSANYVMNEYVDAGSDAFHPKKKLRPSVSKNIKVHYVVTLYLILVIATILLATKIGKVFFLLTIAYLILAVIYNIKPLRVKDLRYFDVIIESANNPVRLTFGWALVSANTLPPPSLLLSFWCLGAFLMGAKRLSEYVDLSKSLTIEEITGYRKSLARYTEKSLIRLVLLNGFLTVMFLTIFAIKYKPEFLILVLIILTWIVVFFEKISLSESIAQAPEKLLKDSSTRLFIFLVFIAYLISQFTELSILKTLVDSRVLDVSKFLELLG